MSILIKNISYLDVENEKILQGDIYIEGSYIKKLGKDLNIKADRIINGSDKLAIPSLTNSHTHLGMSMMKNLADDLELNKWLTEKIWPVEAKLTDEDIYWASMLSIIENIKSGVSTVCDMYYSLNKVSEAVIESGIRGVITRGLMDVDGDGQGRLDDFINIYNSYNNQGEGRVKILPGPHAIYTCSKEYLEKILEIAKKYNCDLNIHVSETEREVKDCFAERNMTPIEYLDSIGFLENRVIAAHCTHITSKEIELIRNREFYPIYNPTSNLKLASGFTPVNDMLDANIIMGIGTDGSSSNNNQDLIEEMHIGSIVNKAVTKNAEAVKAIDIIKMATVNGARIMGYNSGIIKEEMLADIAILDLDSNSFTPKNNLISALCYSTNSNDVKDLIINGKIIMENREIKTIDEEKVKYMVNKLTKNLLNR